MGGFFFSFFWFSFFLCILWGLLVQILGSGNRLGKGSFPLFPPLFFRFLRKQGFGKGRERRGRFTRMVNVGNKKGRGIGFEILSLSYNNRAFINPQDGNYKLPYQLQVPESCLNTPLLHSPIFLFFFFFFLCGGGRQRTPAPPQGSQNHPETQIESQISLLDWIFVVVQSCVSPKLKLT